MTSHDFLKKIGIFGLVVASAVACGSLSETAGGASGISDDETSSEESGEAVIDSSLLAGIQEITFDTNNQATVVPENLSVDSDYLVGLFSHDFETGVYAYQLGSASSSASLSSYFLHLMGGDDTADAHEFLRDQEALLAGDPFLATSSLALFKQATTGSNRTFKVLNSLSGSSSYDLVAAILRYQTANVAIYVDVRNAAALGDTELQSIVDDFDQVIDSERNLFGEESDVNTDGQFTVLMSQAINELGASGGGIITGFFYAVDLYPTSMYSLSNEMEIIYTLVPDPTAEFGAAISKSFMLSNILPSVLPHEFQHMINYNQHVFQNGGTSELSFLNEALSHLAEDIYSLEGDYMSETGIENPSRVQLYLAANASTCFTCGSSLTQRGGSYLFVRYLYEQAELGNLPAASNGADFLSRIMDTTLTGVGNIVFATMATTNTDYFKNLLGPYGLAVVLSNTGLTSDARYNFSGINLWATQEDNRGTVLNGPVIETPMSLPFADSLYASGYAYIYLSGEEISNQGGSLPIAVSSTMKAGGYLLELDALTE